jgi:hypothetical protein
LNNDQCTPSIISKCGYDPPLDCSRSLASPIRRVRVWCACVWCACVWCACVWYACRRVPVTDDQPPNPAHGRTRSSAPCAGHQIVVPWTDTTAQHPPLRPSTPGNDPQMGRKGSLVGLISMMEEVTARPREPPCLPTQRRHVRVPDKIGEHKWTRHAHAQTPAQCNVRHTYRAFRG